MKPQDGNNSHVSNTENFFGGNETGKPIKQETDNGIQEEMTTRGDANSGNSIPTITDTTTPIVLFVGPGSSGKSMILVSLAKYFYSKSYTIAPNENFYNTSQYKADCKEFNNRYNADKGKALAGTSGFLLVDVYQGSQKKLQMLEAPGEDYIKFNSPTDPIPQYLANILAAPNKKIWVMLLDLHSEFDLASDNGKRHIYTQKLIDYYEGYVNRDRDAVILLYNQIDAHNPKFGTYLQISNFDGAEAFAKQMYPTIFSSFVKRPLAGLLGSFPNFKFHVYCTGFYGENKEYTACDSVYPYKLYQEIIRRW